MRITVSSTNVGGVIVRELLILVYYTMLFPDTNTAWPPRWVNIKRTTYQDGVFTFLVDNQTSMPKIAMQRALVAYVRAVADICKASIVKLIAQHDGKVVTRIKPSVRFGKAPRSEPGMTQWTTGALSTLVTLAYCRHKLLAYSVEDSLIRFVETMSPLECLPKVSINSAIIPQNKALDAWHAMNTFYMTVQLSKGVPHPRIIRAKYI